MSNQEVSTTTNRPGSLMAEWRADVNRMEGQFKMALPAHIPVERFIRVVLTALQNNQKLLACSKQSFFNACVRCAQDGLLPDGREAAIVPFGEEGDSGRSRADLAGYMPMVAGIRKKIRNSGEIKDLRAAVVYEGDEFAYELGDEPFIRHKPKPGGRTRPIRYVYSIAVFRDGTLSRDVMPIEEVEEVRKKFSRSKKGPWSVPESYAEMALKTVVKHHAKTLPMSTDLDRLMHADDALYDLKGAADQREATQPAPRPKSLQSAFDMFAADETDGDSGDNDGGDLQTETAASEAKTESRTESSTNQERSPTGTRAAASAADPHTGSVRSGDGEDARVENRPSSHGAAPTLFVDPIKQAEQEGRDAHEKGVARKPPGEYRDKPALAAAWHKGWDTADGK